MRVLITETTWNAMAAAKDLAAARFRLSRADDAEELLEFVRNGAQDAALVSTRLPDASAAETLVRLRRLAPRLPAIVLSDGPLAGADRKALYEAGADAVLGLPMEPAELAARIRAMVLRAAGYATSRVCIGGLELDPVTRSACVGRRSVRLPGDGCHGARRIPLSPREYDVLELLVLARGRTVDRAEVMDRLYAFEDEPGPRIVDVYVARIRAKLARAGLAPGMIVSIRGRGLRLAPAGPPPSGRGRCRHGRLRPHISCGYPQDIGQDGPPVTKIHFTACIAPPTISRAGCAGYRRPLSRHQALGAMGAMQPIAPGP